MMIYEIWHSFFTVVVPWAIKIPERCEYGQLFATAPNGLLSSAGRALDF